MALYIYIVILIFAVTLDILYRAKSKLLSGK